jgi:hypothetical protein
VAGDDHRRREIQQGDSVSDNLGKEEVSFSPCVTSFTFQIFHVQSYRRAGLYAHGSYTAQWALHQTTFPSIDS